MHRLDVLKQAIAIAVIAPALRAQPVLGRLEGTLVNAVTGDPVPQAQLELRSKGELSRLYTGSTNSEGRFLIFGIAEGAYALRARARGFIERDYHTRLRTNDAEEIRFSRSAPLREIRFRMIPAARISGRVVDGDGDPIPEADIRLFRVNHRGLESERAVATETSDDEGRFRFASLSPGRYVVRAGPAQAVFSRWEDRAGLPVEINESFVEPADALRPIEVAAGAQIAGVELRLTLARIAKVRVSVPGVTPGFRIFATRPGASLSFRSQGRERGVTLDIPLPQGDWTLEVQGSGTAKGVARIQVSGADQSIEIPLIPLRYVTATRQFDRRDEAPALGRTEVLLADLDKENYIYLSKTGEDTMRGVALAGRFWITTPNLPAGIYLKEALWNRARLRGPLVLEDNEGGELTLVFSTGAATIGVAAAVDGRPCSGAEVILAPAGAEGPVQSKVASESGHAEFANLAPGAYDLLAAEDPDPGALLDPAVRRAHAKLIARVTVRAGESKQLTLRAIPAEPLR